jgi:hypothetical protein
MERRGIMARFYPVMATLLALSCFFTAESPAVDGPNIAFGKSAIASTKKELQVLAGMNASIGNVFADRNGDGKVDLAEVIYVLQKLAGMRQNN